MIFIKAKPPSQNSGAILYLYKKSDLQKQVTQKKQPTELMVQIPPGTLKTEQREARKKTK